ncbi:MAG: hypothetical protein R3B54_15045 [Bdellovibrionota bacterium]
MRRLEGDENYSSFMGMFLHTLLALEPNDALFSKQYGLKKIGMPEVWEQTQGSADVVVAVVDTGVQLDHEDLKPQHLGKQRGMGLDAEGRDKSSNRCRRRWKRVHR